jgi:hypothetical protein
LTILKSITVFHPSFGPCSLRSLGLTTLVAILAAGLSGCGLTDGSDGQAVQTPAQAHALIMRALPPDTPDRVGWATDIYAAFAALKRPSTADNVCAVIAVTEQESSFRGDPTVPGLSKIAWKEIEDRAQRLGVPSLVVRTALRISSPDGRSYSERIDKATTERELSEIFEDLVGLVPMGKSLFGAWNPVRTGGPMQVSIAFAQEHARARTYPYPVKDNIRREVFTRHGGMYFGIAHLIDYDASYDSHLYRFADFNAGHYASRNAAFQNAVSVASGRTLVLDGDLIDHSAEKSSDAGSTELAARALGGRLKMSDSAIRSDLEEGNSQAFENSQLYRRVFALAEQGRDRPLPRAVVPRIRLKSPKITRNLTTAWFAERVDTRYKRCLERTGRKDVRGNDPS